MKLINNISISAIPFIILIIIGNGIIEKNKIFDIFIEGAKDGLQIIIKLFPTLLGLFVAIGCLRSSGILELINYLISPILNKINFPNEILPLAILRPISGSAAIAIATNIMENYGVDSRIGKIASTIMGSTETTLYTIAIYTSCINVKKTRGIIIPALIADLICVIVSIIIWNFLG